MESEKILIPPLKHFFFPPTLCDLHLMSKRFPPLVEGEYYHIYNRGNNREQIFYTDSNYNFFLKKIKLLIRPFAHIYCYSLLPNHFHLFIRIKSVTEFPPGKRKFICVEQIVSNQFRKLFISYARMINNQQSRTGSLFEKNFRRKTVDNNAYFSYLVFYIHSNAEKHGITNDFRNYNYSSFGKIKPNKECLINQTELLSWFGNIKQFNSFHEINRPLVQIEKLVQILLPV